MSTNWSRLARISVSNNVHGSRCTAAPITETTISIYTSASVRINTGARAQWQDRFKNKSNTRKRAHVCCPSHLAILILARTFSRTQNIEFTIRWVSVCWAAPRCACGMPAMKKKTYSGNVYVYCAICANKISYIFAAQYSDAVVGVSECARNHVYLLVCLRKRVTRQIRANREHTTTTHTAKELACA